MIVQPRVALPIRRRLTGRNAGLLPAVLATALLGGCAGGGGAGYPSLAIRDAERASGTFAPADPAPPAPPPEAAPATIGQLDELSARAVAAHAKFEREAGSARSTIGAAAGAAAGSESWARAQVALAGLEAQRSQVTIALADMDRIYVDAGVAGEVPVRVAEAHAQVSALLAQEDAVIARLAESLR